MFAPFPILYSERLELRKIVPTDIDSIFYGLSHPEVIPYYGVSFSTLAETQSQMDWFLNLETTQTGIWWAVCDRETSTFLGAGGLNDLSQEHKKAEVGFWLLPEYWGKGYMQEAMPLILNFGLKQAELRRIEGFVESNNANCKRALAKLAFEYEGTMKDCEVKNGKFISIDIYARFSAE